MRWQLSVMLLSRRGTVAPSAREIPSVRKGNGPSFSPSSLKLARTLLMWGIAPNIAQSTANSSQTLQSTLISFS
ncbi:hypothetical protein TNCV_4485711 [Trichonephila clavipes]|nr:hypothetical protein TNCV_4485711 [Trichonephila clavipes]